MNHDYQDSKFLESAAGESVFENQSMLKSRMQVFNHSWVAGVTPLKSYTLNDQQ